MENNQNNSISIAEIIREDFPRKFGIPHFQRGLVWSDEDVSKLLESLYYTTPCGSFVFWSPVDKNIDNLKRYGTPLKGEEFSEKDFRYFIIDGQQRIRNIIEIFDENDKKDKNKPVWCINLLKIEEIKEKFNRNSNEDDRYNLFIKRIDPLNLSNDKKKDGGHRYNYLPLYVFDENEFQKKENLIRERIKIDNSNNDYTAIKDEIIKELKNTIIDRISNIKSKIFHFDIIPNKKNDDESFAFAIESYNRINKGGKRVEAEEIAFATLVAHHSKEINEFLEECYKNTKGSTDSDSNFSRKDYLKRVKEKNFGFKFFLRVLIQNLQYHRNVSSGNDRFSFDIINNKVIRYFSKEQFNQILKSCKGQIKYLYEIITDELKCDYFETLPETFSLQAIIQILIQYPEIIIKNDENAKKTISGLVLGILLSNFDYRSILKMIKEIKRGDKLLNESIDFIVKQINSRLGNEKFLFNNLRDADSLQNRYVLLLYWLERKNNATELDLLSISKKQDWENYYDDKKKRFEVYYEKLFGKEPEVLDFERINNQIKGTLLNSKLNPQRQHIVPYSSLKNIYKELKESDGGRISTHNANNIGNITWISAISNSLDLGIGNDFLNLDIINDENLKARLLLEERNRAVLNKFNDVRKKYKKGKLQRKDFEKFTDLRCGLIAKSFINWYNELISQRDKIERYEPIQRLLSSSDYDKIREFNYPNKIEDMTIGLIAGRIKDWKTAKNKDRRDVVKKLKNQISEEELSNNDFIIVSNEKQCAITFVKNAIILFLNNNLHKKLENLTDDEMVINELEEFIKISNGSVNQS